MLRLNFIADCVKSYNWTIISNLSIFIAIFFVLHLFIVFILFKNIRNHFIVIFINQLWLKFQTYHSCVLLLRLQHRLIIACSIVNFDYWQWCHWFILWFLLLLWRRPVYLHSAICTWINTLCFSSYLNAMLRLWRNRSTPRFVSFSHKIFSS